MASCPASPTNCWITVPAAAASGTIPAFSKVGIPVLVTAPLSPGTYAGSVLITRAGAILNVPINVIVSPGPKLSLSQTGVQFQTVSNSTGTLTQSISVANQGTGLLSFSATGTALSGGSWLSVSPGSGSKISTAPAQVTIQANPSGLAPGAYFGRVDFLAPGATSSPQTVEVILTVLSPTAAAPPVISPTALIFVAPSIGNPATQTVQVASPTNQPLTVTSKLNFANGSGWFTATPSGSSQTIAVSSGNLSPGVYLGSLDLHVAESNTDSAVSVVLVVPKPSCIPTQLLTVFTNLPGAFQMTSGLPIPLQAQVTDNCGAALKAGAVTAYFGGADTPLSLVSLGNGQWSGTWLPHAIGGGAVTAGISAISPAPALFGSSGVSGSLLPNANTPLILAGGVVSAASLAPSAPIAPGSYISIFGSNLAASSTTAGASPYPASLGGTRVLMGGEALALQFVGPGQINAIIPYDAAFNTTQQLIVERNGHSLPETVVVGPAQPAVFTQDQSGQGAGAIAVVKPDGTQFLNTSSTPASAGDVLVIYGTGLGAVSPPVPAGSAAPLSPLSTTVNTVTVSVGGQPAQVLFAGLTPGYPGLYQVNAIVPSGTGSGSAVSIIVTVAGAASSPVTVAIQ